jgi:hypothetical protein
MDGQKPSPPLHDLCGQPGNDAVPIAAGIEQSGGPDDSLAVSRCDSIDRPSATQRESSPVVYYGTDERVNEGFAIALFAMGLDAHFLPADIALPAQNPNREDDYA